MLRLCSVQETDTSTALSTGDPAWAGRRSLLKLNFNPHFGPCTILTGKKADIHKIKTGIWTSHGFFNFLFKSANSFAQKRILKIEAFTPSNPLKTDCKKSF
ncbi:hypothetical protein SAMN04487988_1149 [Algoriphagus hitonicola]|uniref:Uncharacterized protein n=1 Tax=Algoriphagus hitonicola TaxID=435880 RepID=A0A1I2WW38_9BACT|nr:hypothetical protein SAMN04487988_1149 [Algoriphagus hitonicola]